VVFCAVKNILMSVVEEMKKVATNLPPPSCTVFYIYYTKLLHVSAIYPGHLQGGTSLVDLYNMYGNLPYTVYN
jgi:hypothetical protein